MTVTPSVLHGEPSLPLTSDVVQGWLTPRGGMLGPVNFVLPSGRVVRPYSVAPWLPVEAAASPALLQVLRGDFFCFPFGESPGVPEPHGPTANLTWSLVSAEPTELRLRMNSAAPVATIEKRVRLRPGHTVLYQEHTVWTSGRFNYGHHPILEVPEGCVAEVRTSPFRFGAVYPGAASRPTGEHGVLAAGHRFSSLEDVPLAAGGATSLRRYPTRPGTEDIVMLAGFDPPHAWTAVTLDGYVWFSLRRTSDFPGTLFWMSDAGRSFPPWNGRHARRIGVEDVCSHYCDGTALSTQDLLAGEGIPTSRSFSAIEPVRLPHVQGVAAVPDAFGGVASLEPDPAAPLTSLQLVAESGHTVRCPLDWNFLAS